MATIKKRAADDQIKDTQTADEVLDKVVDQGTMFDQAQDESHDESTVPDSANVGDNYAGNTDTVSDTDDLKPVTTSAAMRLADAYIKAGVLKEADRYNAIDRIASTMTRTAARNQLTALELVRKANKKASMEMLPKSQWEPYLGPGDHDDIARLDVDRSDPDSFMITYTDGRTTVFGPDDIDHYNPDSWIHKNKAKDVLKPFAHASKKRKAVTVRKAEDGSFTITTDPGFSATMTQTDDGVDGVVNGEEQHFNTMDEAMQYISDNSGLDMNADGPTDVEAAKKAAARKAAIRKAARKIAARKAAAKRAEKKPVHRMTAAQRKELAARIAKAKRAAKISSNDNKSMREAALAAARKKVARNPRLASASTAASADASLSLI